MIKVDSVQFEHQFWLQILGDHSRFIFNALSPKEHAEIEKSHEFMHTLDTLLDQARQCISSNDLFDFTEEVSEVVCDLREFKLHLIRRHLIEGIELHLTPTFINHMVNELEEYSLILNSLLEDKTLPCCHPVHYHHIWLLDAVGHSGFIHCTLDETENELRETSRSFQKDFTGLHEKAMEYKGYLRTGLENFPALERLNCQVNREMDLFKKFLTNLVDLRISLEALGTISPLAPDHMYREECYYLTKLAQAGAIPFPTCDPTKPRIELNNHPNPCI